MQIKIKEYTPDREGELVDLLSSQSWDYHSTPKITKEKVLEQLKNGYYTSSETRTFLIATGNEKAVGMIRLFDLGPHVNDDKETPLFDIRLNAKSRSKGIGTEAVKWITDFVFINYPNKHRFEATTRADNIAMRKVLEKCGFTKEAHYREAWPDPEGRRYDCAGYSILKKEWQSKIKTSVNFDDAV
jgi:RimJ/RimL family protein N-acetyltransferase